MVDITLLTDCILFSQQYERLVIFWITQTFRQPDLRRGLSTLKFTECATSNGGPNKQKKQKNRLWSLRIISRAPLYKIQFAYRISSNIAKCLRKGNGELDHDSQLGR